MKKIYLTILSTFLFVSLSFSQSTRTVLVEEFTNASCGPCAQQNPNFNTLLNSLDGQNVIALKYQVSFPGFDPMHNLNPGEVNTRQAYYAVTGVPSAYYDGRAFTGGAYVAAPANATAGVLNTRKAVESELMITADHTLSEDLNDITVTITITNEGDEDFDASNLRLRAALSEKEILFNKPPGSTNEKDFSDVFRKFVNDGSAGGQGLQMIAAGETLTFEYAEENIFYYDYRNLEVTAYIQNDANKNVINAARSNAKPVANAIDLGITSSIGTLDTYCERAVDGSITLVNTGDIEVTSADVELLVNDTPIETLELTDLSIPAGGTEVITFDDISLLKGINSFSATVANVNGRALDLSLLNNEVVDIVRWTFGEELLPVVDYGFEDTEFEDEGDFTDESLVGLAIAKANGASIGDASRQLGGYGESYSSVLVDFLTWNPANSDPVAYMAYGEMDMSDINSAKLSFDRSSADYTGPANNDKIEIEMSTDCGSTWTEVFEISGNAMRTGSPTTARWIPTATTWATDEIDISDYDGESNVSMRFKFTTAWGNSLWIDNVKIEGVTGVEEIANETLLSVYPNPASNVTNLSLELAEAMDVNLIVTDISGRIIDNVNYGQLSGKSTITYENDKLSNGMYLFKLNADNQSIIRKVSILK